MPVSNKPDPATAVGDILSSSSNALAHVGQALAQHKQLTQQLNALLPPELKGFVLVLSRQQGKLLLGVTCQSAAAKLRYYKTDLLHQLRQTPELAGLASIEMRLTESERAIKKRPTMTKRKLLSPAVRATIEAHVLGTNNKDLQASLQKFIRHHCQQ